jgi:hypothetical protein
MITARPVAALINVPNVISDSYCCRIAGWKKVLSSSPKTTTHTLAGHYDKILKENIAAIFLPLAEKYLGIHILKSEELKDKVQVTLEKEPDFIRIVETREGERFILHIEFQRTDEEGMVYRMQEYYGILRRKYKLPVRPIVFYLGQNVSLMQTRLAPEEVFDGFLLISLNEYSSRNYLRSCRGRSSWRYSATLRAKTPQQW